MNSIEVESKTTSVPEEADKTEYWVFGYGSLVWKPPPAYNKKVPGYIKGHVRRFWQACTFNYQNQRSTDHRGTIEKPGRVVTLIPIEEWKLLDDFHDHKEDDVTWGIAYKISEEDIKEMMDYLDYREKNGYTIHYLDVYQLGSGEPIVKNAMVYIGTTKNEEYVGPAPLNSLALQICECPSGSNREYLFKLASALREIAPDAYDGHLFDLEERVKNMIKKSETS
ncbi:5455_t:CDS:2 [Funneliformis geosporum]|uniref:glutathione-specific gamma-glutamylcyclotransferase n=1 Tax=Funneliformis geosporum TaxID=1117311 RepID=A0A9W4SDG5_9GLOM|nr:5455_t:CDS:2 [Funneliformis geosporum]CAI2165676.1 6307_t:CDS:2 [Funneliformis geosporum]